MQSLLDLLRGRLSQRNFSDADFAALLQIAEQENVVPFVAELLRRLDIDFSPPQRKQRDQIHREAQFASFVWTETLKNTLVAFHRAQVPVIALKGPCLAERIYGDPAFRTCYDLDLLVRGSDLSRAEDLLAKLGFSPNARADDYHRPWSRQGTNLELHHNVENPDAFEFDINSAWTRATPTEFHQAPLWLLSPPDELMYLCLHAVRHRFERVCLILDLALAFRRIPLAAPSVREWSSPVFDNIFALGWMMASRLDPDLPPAPAMRLTPGNRSRLEKLADRLWQELMLAKPPTLDWVAQHRFYLELENPGWNRLRRRMRHQRILATRLIEDDFRFAGRFHLHRNWQVRLLRPVRLLIKTLRPAPKMP
jgi:hypothetical protein